MKFFLLLIFALICKLGISKEDFEAKIVCWGLSKNTDNFCFSILMRNVKKEIGEIFVGIESINLEWRTDKKTMNNCHMDMGVNFISPTIQTIRPNHVFHQPVFISKNHVPKNVNYTISCILYERISPQKVQSISVKWSVSPKDDDFDISNIEIHTGPEVKKITSKD